MEEDQFKQFLEHLVGHAEPDYSKWQQVTRLGPEQKLKQRLFIADSERRQSQSKVLAAKLAAITAEQNAAHAEYWEYLHDSLQFSRDGSYHITDEGAILKAPKEVKHG